MKSLLAVLVTLVLYYILYRMQKRKLSLMVRVLTATAMGAVLGFIFMGHTDYVVVFGKVYANLLMAFVIPLLVFSIVATIINIGDMKTLGSIGGRILGFLSLHNILGSIIAIIVGGLMHLGLNSGVQFDKAAELEEVPHFSEVIISFFPRNIVDNMANNNIVPIVIFSVIVGLVILIYEDKSEIQAFIDFVQAGNKLMNRAIGAIVKFTPYAVLSLLANQVSSLDLSFVTSLLSLLAAVYIACLFHSFITSSAMVALFSQHNPFKVQRKIFPAWLVGFTTQSSIGSIPASVKSQRSLGVPENIASISASIGTTFGMPGCAAIWPVLLAIFTINALNIDFGLNQYVLMIGAALLASIGTVGVPGTGTIQATALFAAMGLPVEMILVLSPIAGVADMARTSTNVHTGAITGFLVAAREHSINEEEYATRLDEQSDNF
ncbi:dicarboxylate/amino acid:cation symporter [Aerococcus sanguinicola]|uniref:dicarboxylate/amino acid:cation symporter n=1 Tax=unclassified Aerococcus TaxID=2618060 RepID=UPI000AF8511C|nr:MULTISPECIES: dicarboxylate/amino acid:cation symporter [unclassified Aerococcus]MDK6233447.1 dicarboxylate/amino acid:cation symporter [Aerococcus sp. UMB10185]MDK6805447.1 dicarboxylate/amino acid:cation symporter [Aerococcus sp. UMB7834]MDK6855570.1 dicarboxylate/amino acid:cation symporter [Aerococcus sp. UMB7533]MDK8502289.1 dicarboxylate/amino acid:cation symporter [Aerococcus sp. UMB1112A]